MSNSTISESTLEAYKNASIALSVFVLLGFAIYSVIYTAVKTDLHLARDTEDFITARRTSGKWSIAWSFYASAVGAWVITAPASYANFAGYIGLVSYSIASGFPILMIAFFGRWIRASHPDVISLSHFCSVRFGKITQVLVTCITVLNMSIALIGEYTTVGSLFKDFVGIPHYPMVITVALLTLGYTTYGGLRVSILTDKVQAICSVVLVMVLTIYVCATFRYPLETPLPENLGPNYYGYSSIVAMPLSLLTATVFSEAMWQRVWASEDDHALKFGAGFATVAVIVVVFLAGFAGYLASWAGLADEEPNTNLLLFHVFRTDATADTSTGLVVSSWTGILTLILAVTMNESAVDSLQNGLLSSIAGQFFKSKSISYSRVVVLIINIPFIIIGAQGYNVANLYLIANVTCCGAALPIILGLYQGRYATYLTDGASLFSFLVSQSLTIVYGIVANKKLAEEAGDELSTGQMIADGLWYTYYGNNYSVEFFLVALGGSVFGCATWVGVNMVLRSRAEALDNDERRVVTLSKGLEKATVVPVSPEE